MDAPGLWVPGHPTGKLGLHIEASSPSLSTVLVGNLLHSHLGPYAQNDPSHPHGHTHTHSQVYSDHTLTLLYTDCSSLLFPVTTLPPPETLRWRERSLCTVIQCSHISSQAGLSWKEIKRNRPQLGAELGLSPPSGALMRLHRAWAGADSPGTWALSTTLCLGTGERDSLGPLHTFPAPQVGLGRALSPACSGCPVLLWP